MSQVADRAAPHWAAWLDSMEGVPEWPQSAESPAERAARGTVMARAHEAFGWAGAILPGLGLALGLAAAGRWAAHGLGEGVLGFSRSPVSEIAVAVVLGLLIRNTVGLPAVYERGLRLCGREVLRLGIVLLGLRLSLAAVGQFGLAGLPVILGVIAAALAAVAVLTRALGLPRRLGGLIAVGTSICGVSAIVATAPAIKAEEDEVSYAVACVTLFGLAALFAYPFVGHGLFPDDPRLAGLFLGTAIHDTSQVAGAGLVYQDRFDAPAALEAATVAKLTRNLCMVGVIPLVVALYRDPADAKPRSGRLRLAQAVPLFVLGFLTAAAARTVGDIGDRPFGLLDRSVWKESLAHADEAAGWCLMAAMAAVGLGTGLGRLRRLGWKAFCAGLATAAAVGGVSAALIAALGALLS
jgi:uncharacterized integral membrane protein (TIGR00698 family)